MERSLLTHRDHDKNSLSLDGSLHCKTKGLTQHLNSFLTLILVLDIHTQRENPRDVLVLLSNVDSLP